LFETDEDPNFKITIRDFSFPPDRHTYTLSLPFAAFLHLLSGSGEISIAKKQLALTPTARTAVPANTVIEVVNNGEHETVVRALIVEAK
jgi:quercetin dioxygenase-like cupin family protein